MNMVTGNRRFKRFFMRVYLVNGNNVTVNGVGCDTRGDLVIYGEDEKDVIAVFARGQWCGVKLDGDHLSVTENPE